MDPDLLDLINIHLLLGFIGVMLLAPFVIMIGMALPRRTRPTAVSEKRQPTSGGRGTLEV